jgi:hypothetical protein
MAAKIKGRPYSDLAGRFTKYGIEIGVLENADDRESLGRVRERILIIDDTGRWARIVAPLRYIFAVLAF